MSIVTKEVRIADELNDVMDLIKAIIVTVKDGGDYAGLVSELISAITGIDKIPAEFKEDIQACINTVTLASTDIAFLFVKSNEVAE